MFRIPEFSGNFQNFVTIKPRLKFGNFEVSAYLVFFPTFCLYAFDFYICLSWFFSVFGEVINT